MECDSAEVTCTEAASVVSNRELNLGYGRNTALGNIIGVEVSGVRKSIHTVELLSLKGRHRRILHEHLVTVILDYSLTVYGICVFVLDRECLGICALVTLELVIVTYLEALKMHRIPLLRKVYRASDVAYLLNRNALVKKLGKSYENILAHTVCKNVCSRVNENTSSYSVIPVVVVSKAAQRCLKTAYNDRHVTVCLSDSVTVNDNCSVRSFAHFTTRCVVIVGASFLGYGIVRNHGVDVTAGNEEAESWASESLEVVAGAEIGLRKYRYSEALSLKHS